MTISQQQTEEYSGIDDLTLAEVETRLKQHQQLLNIVLNSSPCVLPYLSGNNTPLDQQPASTAEQYYQQALQLTDQQQNYQAASCYCHAAYAGHLQAQVQLGHCYLKGAGVPKSAVFAYSWFILAALQQDSTAEQACTVLSKHLTVQDQQQAHQLAAERFEKITLKINR